MSINIDTISMRISAIKEIKGHGYFRRFDKTFIGVKNAVSSGDLGTLLAIKTTTRDSPKPCYEFLKSAGRYYFSKYNSLNKIIYTSIINRSKGLVWALEIKR